MATSFTSFGCSIDLDTLETYCNNNNYQLSEGNTTILGKIRLDNYNELRYELQGELHSHLQVILAAWHKWGKNILDHVFGDFAFIIVDTKKKSLFAARDHLGVSPFFYRQNGNKLQFSTSLRKLVGTNVAQLDDEYQIRYLNGYNAGAASTIYRKIYRLPPAHSLEFREEQLRTERYWQLTCPPERKIGKEHAISEFRQHLWRAVRCRLPEPGTHLGCELSGGMDSGTVTGIAAKLFDKKNLFTFSHVMREEDLAEAEYKDERLRVKSLCEFHEGLNNILIDDREQGRLEDLKLHTSILATVPAVNVTASSHRLYEEAYLAKCEVVFSGFGGDEGISMRSPGTFINEMIEKKRWADLIGELRLKRPLLWPLVLGKRLYRFHRNSLVVCRSRKVSYNYLLKDQYKMSPPTGRRSNENCFKRCKSLLPDRLHTAERLEETVLAAEYYGIEYRFPLLDVQLILYYLSLPPELKLHEGLNRYILRQATKDVLPDNIRLGIKEPGATVPSTARRRKAALEKKEIYIADLPWICRKSRERILKNIYSENPDSLKVSFQQAYYLTVFHEFYNSLRHSLTRKTSAE